jgi:hypothetical protein
MKLFKALLPLFVFALQSAAQNITIKGKADSSHIGKQIILSDYLDYVSYTKIIEETDTVDKNGYFEFKIYSKTTKPIFISIDNLVGKIYIQPNFVYGIYFPGKDSLNNNQEGTESYVNISVYGKDSTELNALIIDFNTQYNNLFLNSKDAYLTPTKINALLDTFLLASKKRYQHIKNPYFKKYVEYSFANFYTNTSKNKNFLYNQFIAHKPILYTNYEYMDFFNAHFKGYLKAYASTKNGGSIYNSINSFGSYQDLKREFSSDKTTSNDTLKDLLILKGLIDFYYSPDINQQQVKTILEQLYRESKIVEHQKIALNTLQNFYQLQPGANAPNFKANDIKGNDFELQNLKGKYVYLNYFSTQSDVSMKEMQKIIDLQKKFNDKVTFVSVCLDDSLKQYLLYLKANPKQNWIILHQGKNSTAKQAYQIISFSGFFFINQQMQLAQSPALAPSEGIEYKFNALFRPRKKNTIPGIR